MADKRKNLQKLKMNIETGSVPFAEYPRPQLIRQSKWINLNGKWDCGVVVPFPLQSELSEYNKLPEYNGKVPDEYDYYTSFEYYKSGDYPKGCRVLLHFGAVDQICDVSIDGVYVGHHEGGYLPFTFDITDKVAAEGAHVLQVHVTDKLDIKYPYGKQSKTPGGMWYTPVSGIWQTVWIEEVPREYIRGIKITPDLDGIRLIVDGDARSYSVEVYEPDTGFNPAKRIVAPGDSTPHRMIYRETYNGNKTYIEIASETGASTATISRVNRSLNCGNGSYDYIFKRLNQKD